MATNRERPKPEQRKFGKSDALARGAVPSGTDGGFPELFLARSPDACSPEGFQEVVTRTLGLNGHVARGTPKASTKGRFVVQLDGNASHRDAVHFIVETPPTASLEHVCARLLSHAYSFRRFSGAILSRLAGREGPLSPLAPGARLTVVELAKAYVHILSDTLRFDCCSLYLWDSRGRRLAVVAAKGYKPEWADHAYTASRKALTLLIGEKGKTIRGSAQQLKGDHPNDWTGRCNDYIARGKWRNTLGIPLVLDGRIVGVAKLENTIDQLRSHEITDEDEDVASLICRSFLSELSNVEAAFVKTQSPAMVSVLDDCHEKAALANDPILLTGFRGVGKTLLARYIHLHSPRRDRPFKRVNCTEDRDARRTSRMLLDYVASGQFANGNGEFKTLIRENSGGTVYFEDLTALTGEAQASFPAVIENLHDDDVRVIASVPLDLSDPKVRSRILSRSAPAAENGIPRLESTLLPLFIGATVNVPGLSERTGDIPLLVRHFMAELYCKRGMGVAPDYFDDEIDAFTRACAREARKGMQVSQLRTVVERACLTRQKLATVLKDLQQERFDELTPQEKEEWIRVACEDWMANPDRTGEDVADDIGIDHRTLQKYMTKLGVRSPRTIRRACESWIADPNRTVEEVAGNIGMNVPAFEKCMSSLELEPPDSARVGSDK